MGIDPIQAFVVPRVIAATIVALLLNGCVTIFGLTGGFLFSVFFQHVTPGAYVSGLTLLVGLPEVATATAKSALFGMAAAMIACYKGISVGGGPQGVGNAVNETVVFSFMALFLINVIATGVGVEVAK
jgi:phospholipid/cholesterol/gamma-HCH transport system permease protein